MNWLKNLRSKNNKYIWYIVNLNFKLVDFNLITWYSWKSFSKEKENKAKSKRLFLSGSDSDKRFSSFKIFYYREGEIFYQKVSKL